MNQDVKEKPSVQTYTPQPGKEQEGRSNHWDVRTQEQAYAFLPEQPIAEKNRYGQLIDLVDLTQLPKNRSMYINENPEVGTNPNRNKQHGFFFTADNCIGCHACEAACSEKNENPPHIAFRSVGYVEGGSFPDYKRLNISMACNHCDDPVCLKGCPTKAYTKHAEYGAVLQDPETCFGCGYCTWVCPYNAPQLDPVKGQVSKCNMCVDRLEVGLKPSCVSACVGNALDFGVIENTPENREQCKTQIPGFPAPDITHPNIRFQQTKTLPDEMRRTDSVPVKYRKDAKGEYKPSVDQVKGKQKSWNLAKLNSRENPLVIFTLLSQAAVGAFILPFIGSIFGLGGFESVYSSDMVFGLSALCAALTGVALLFSVSHLGKPIRFYRGFNNLKFSPMAREGFGLSMFAAGAGLAAFFALFQTRWLNDFLQSSLGFSLLPVADVLPISTLVFAASIFAVVSGIGGLYYMYRCYQIKARPFWNHWQTATSFTGNSLSLGAVITALLLLPTLEGNAFSAAATFLALAASFGIALEAIGLMGHNKDLNQSENEGGAAHYVQRTTFGKTYLLRNTLLGVNFVLAVTLAALLLNDITNSTVLWFAVLTILINLATALIGRALFYILVIPTTMPGAFFWKNKSFEQHARDIGLADNPATGVAPHAH